MKKIISTVVLLFLIIKPFAQRNQETDFFKFLCNCEKVNEKFNSNNKSYNYEYKLNAGSVELSIAVKTNTVNPDGFLEAIKNSGTFEYKYTTFRGKKAIVAMMNSNSEYGIHLGFFNGKNGFSILISGTSKVEVNKFYLKLQNSFEFK